MQFECVDLAWRTLNHRQALRTFQLTITFRARTKHVRWHYLKCALFNIEPSPITLVITAAGVLVTVFELLCDYPLSGFSEHHWIHLEVTLNSPPPHTSPPTCSSTVCLAPRTCLICKRFRACPGCVCSRLTCNFATCAYG